MKRVGLQSILFFLYYIHSKVLVIDDLGVTNSLNSDKKELIDKVRKKIKSNNEEVVIYGKNALNRDTRISSTDIDLEKKKQKQEELQKQLQRINNQKIINSLRKLVGIPKTSEEDYPKDQPPERLRDPPDNKTRVFKLGDINNGIEIDEPVIERSSPGNSAGQYDFNDYLGDFQNKRNTNIDQFPSPHLNYPYSFPTHQHADLGPSRDSPLHQSPPTNTNLPYNDTQEFLSPHIQHLDFDSFNQPSQNTKDNISILKSQEKINLLKAINNRKEYLRIKIEEVHSKKEKISQQLGEYKSKIDEIISHINSIKNNRDSILTKMNMEKNHISNLSQNSKEIKDKEDKLRSLIRVTRNEIIRYKSLLENEKSKMDVLEKQYEVYENTLKKYNSEANQEGNNLSKFTNELCKYENDLKDLNDMFSIYNNKHIELNNELKRQAKLESNLEIEENKINRNHLDDLI